MKSVIITNATAIASARNSGWWMESSIKDNEITFKNEKDLKKQLESIIKDQDYALNKRIKFNNMYIDDKNGDAKLVGYVCNIMVDVQSSDDYSWKKGYFELWISLKNIEDLDI